MLSKYWRSKFLFLGLWSWTRLMLLRKGSSNQVEVWKQPSCKNWGKRWIELHRCFVYCQTYLGLLMSLLLLVSPWQRCHGPCWKSKLIQPHVLRKNLQYFNYASFIYIHAFHWLHCSLHCSLHSFLGKKMNLIIVIKKKRTRFTAPLPNPC